MDKDNKGHSLVVENREQVALTGVKRVESFDPKEVILETELGILSIKGEQLGIKRLNLEEGQIDLQGHVVALSYQKSSNNTPRQGLMNKIFR